MGCGTSTDFSAKPPENAEVKEEVTAARIVVKDEMRHEVALTAVGPPELTSTTTIGVRSETHRKTSLSSLERRKTELSSEPPQNHPQEENQVIVPEVVHANREEEAVESDDSTSNEMPETCPGSCRAYMDIIASAEAFNRKLMQDVFDELEC